MKIKTNTSEFAHCPVYSLFKDKKEVSAAELTEALLHQARKQKSAKLTVEDVWLQELELLNSERYYELERLEGMYDNDSDLYADFCEGIDGDLPKHDAIDVAMESCKRSHFNIKGVHSTMRFMLTFRIPERLLKMYCYVLRKTIINNALFKSVTIHVKLNHVIVSVVFSDFCCAYPLVTATDDASSDVMRRVQLFVDSLYNCILVQHKAHKEAQDLLCK